MMTFNDARDLVAQHDGGEEALRECRKALLAGELVEVHPSPAAMTAGDALTTFRIRSRTAHAAGIETAGFDETLRSLAEVATEQEVLMFHLSSSRRTFSLFVLERSRRIIGCIRVNRRAVSVLQ